MKRKLFIGSSSEGKSIAEKLKTKILKECGDWIEAKLWSEDKVFTLNKSTFHSLIQSSRKYEYGVFVATADDLRKKRWHIAKTMRDNVLFEAGMFFGSLGLTRAFLLVDKKCALPSDYAGITLSIYNKTNLDNKISEIIDNIKETQNSYKFSVIPSVALAVGYFENFVKLFAEQQQDKFTLNILMPNSISDIKNQIDVHKSKTKSENYGSTRPIIYKSYTGELWDIPTNLSTLNSVIDAITHTIEIGYNSEKEEWIQYEIRNFAGTLEFLISQNHKCKN
ncbi:MAG: nucleotide-binding protein, partial [Prevotellaceae bacterium]|nr:nucleotide-binding protein [Prevotellaceae bacterium]